MSKSKKGPGYIEQMDYSQEASQCNSCKHFEGYGICPAFPKGIPIAVVLNDVRHIEVLEGQNGTLVYKPK